jgi:hypothetical protein
MTVNTTAIDHADRRLVVALPRPYDEAREHYETLVPHVDSARFSQMGSWQATQELAEINAPHGFMIYYRSDITAAMAGSQSFWKATQYLMGNHVDQPSLLFASYGDPRIAYVGHELDTLLAQLIILLGGGLPLQLAAVYASGNENA